MHTYMHTPYRRFVLKEWTDHLFPAHMCVYVCMHACMHVCTYISGHMRICLCGYMCTYGNIYAYVYIHKRTFRACMYPNVCVCM